MGSGRQRRTSANGATARAEAVLRRQVRAAPGLTVLTGGQTGVDTYAAQAALQAGLSVHLVMPRGRRQEDARRVSATGPGPARTLLTRCCCSTRQAAEAAGTACLLVRASTPRTCALIFQRSRQALARTMTGLPARRQAAELRTRPVDRDGCGLARVPLQPVAGERAQRHHSQPAARSLRECGSDQFAA